MGTTRRPSSRANGRSASEDTTVVVARLAVRAAYVALAAAVVNSAGNVVVALLHH